MTQHSVATPVQNYVESEDLIFEIGDEDDIETPKKKSVDDDHAGYGFETESDEDDTLDNGDDIEEFEDFEWGDEGDDIE